MRGLVASHEAAMGRLTALLESQPSRSVAQMQREAAMEVEALRRVGRRRPLAPSDWRTLPGGAHRRWRVDDGP